MTGIVLRGAFAIIGFWIAMQVLGGIQFDTPATLFLAGLLLGVINAILRPVLVVLTLPITVLTLGLFLLVLNAAMVGLVATLLPGMHVASFGTALATAVIISLTSWVGNAFVKR